MANIKFLKHGIRYKGKYIRIFYSKGALLHHPKGTITIYAREYGSQLPPELKPENNTEIRTDYFEKDRARIKPSSKYYNQVKKFLK